MRADEHENATRLGDSPPALPFRKPFDLTPWQLSWAVLTLGLTLSLETIIKLSDEPFQEGATVSPMTLARVLVFGLGATLVFIQPNDRSIPMWIFVAVRHFWRGVPAVLVDGDDPRPSYFQADAAAMRRMRLEGTGLVFVVDPPFWEVIRHTPFRTGWWRKHTPYRLILPVEPQGSLELMTDNERAARWHAFEAGLRALTHPIQIVVQTRAEDPDWLAERAAGPPLIGGPFARLRWRIEEWARLRARTLILRRIAVTCSAPELDDLTEHVKDVTTMLDEAGLQVRQLEAREQQDIFDFIYGTRRLFPHDTRSFGVDDTEWVTITVRRFPRKCVVGWLSYVIGRLPIDVGLFIEPDDGAWVPKVKDWFEGMCELNTADTAHRDAFADLSRVEAKLKRTEGSVQRATLLLTMPREAVPRLTARLKSAGAIFNETTGEHQSGRDSTLPLGGRPRVGHTRPYDGADVAACYPFGAAGLRTNGALLGTARHSPEAVTLDLRDPSLLAAMVVILGTTGAGKTFLMNMLLARSGLPFVVIDMKPHLDEVHHGDFYPLVREAEGDYHVCVPGKPLPTPHPFAQAYNLAMVPDADKPELLRQIGEQEWARAVESLEDRIFAVDEAYWLGKTTAGQELVERIVSQGRSVGLIGVVASQETADFLAQQRMVKAITMASVQFVLAQDKSMVDRVAHDLNLGGEAHAELAKFQPSPGDTIAASTRSAIMRVGQRMVSFRIEACDEEYALYTTRPSDKRARREAREEVLA